ncbi:hyalin-like [Strongylocentrotus purpuratus]|uniref:HYR domain-containing protein n=1 Tax=Strongylocentrotus purpuratus TaxID=7668 RepID=A0A7M7HQ52_STRPU|nr:hyalin-like [Strongylocentrotus purpuratus]|eukprot:XP_011683081.1 PREDICTED: hyalin-like [Strongylocentrotus purpuratus]
MGLCQFHLHSIYHVIVITIASNDNSDPVITGCPDDISVAIPSGSTRVAITWTEPTATDNSGTVISESTRSPGDTFDVGTTVITYTFTDGSGNFAICSFSVTVAAISDNIDPVITGCPDDISVAIPSGSTRVAITWTEPTATDNSDSVVMFTTTNSPGDTFSVGTTQVTYSFTDGSGNDAFCTFFVIVSGMSSSLFPRHLFSPIQIMFPTV